MDERNGNRYKLPSVFRGDSSRALDEDGRGAGRREGEAEREKRELVREEEAGLRVLRQSFFGAGNDSPREARVQGGRDLPGLPETCRQEQTGTGTAHLPRASGGKEEISFT